MRSALDLVIPIPRLNIATRMFWRQGGRILKK